MNRLILFILSLILIAILGCSKKPHPPKWYYNVYNSNEYLFATGSAYDKDTAVKNALSNIASQLNVNVSSNLIINKGQHQNYYFKDFYKEVNTKVKNLPITNYKIVKLAKDDINYYVLIKVSKKDIATTYKNKIEDDLHKVKELITSTKGFDSVVNSYKALKILKEAETLNNIYQQLTSDKTFNQKIITLMDKINYIIKKNKFKIISNNTLFKLYTAKVLTKYVKVSNNSSQKIKLKVFIKKQYILNQYVVNGKALLYLGSRIIEVNFIGKSYSSYNDAVQFALKDYESKLQDKLSSLF